MSRILSALQSLTAEWSGTELAEVLAIPKRTADRWLAELRSGELGNWHAGTIERLADHEAARWGSCRLADALRPETHREHSIEKADADRVARAMEPLIASHLINAQLLGAMAQDLADGVLHEHEARALLPMVDKALAAGMDKQRALTRLHRMLKNRLGHP